MKELQRDLIVMMLFFASLALFSGVMIFVTGCGDNIKTSREDPGKGPKITIKNGPKPPSETYPIATPPSNTFIKKEKEKETVKVVEVGDGNDHHHHDDKKKESKKDKKDKKEFTDIKYVVCKVSGITYLSNEKELTCWSKNKREFTLPVSTENYPTIPWDVKCSEFRHELPGASICKRWLYCTKRNGKDERVLGLACG